MRSRTQRRAGLLLLVCALAASPAQAQVSRLGAPPACPPGQHLCAGPLGAQCYAPSSGATCNAGLLCGAGQRACSGPYGTACYSPASGQQCQSGLVCGAGQRLCAIGGYARCYNPAAGENCN